MGTILAKFRRRRAQPEPDHVRNQSVIWMSPAEEWVRVERTGSSPLPLQPHVHHTCPPMPPGPASCMQLHCTAPTHWPDIRYDLPCSTSTYQMSYQEGKRCWWTLHCVGVKPFLVGPTCRSNSCLRALQESPQRPFGEPQTSNMVGALSKFSK